MRCSKCKESPNTLNLTSSYSTSTNRIMQTTTNEFLVIRSHPAERCEKCYPTRTISSTRRSDTCQLAMRPTAPQYPAQLRAGLWSAHTSAQAHPHCCKGTNDRQISRCLALLCHQCVLTLEKFHLMAEPMIPLSIASLRYTYKGSAVSPFTSILAKIG